MMIFENIFFLTLQFLIFRFTFILLKTYHLLFKIILIKSLYLIIFERVSIDKIGYFPNVVSIVKIKESIFSYTFYFYLKKKLIIFF